VYNITAGNQKLFSKKEAGRFPTEDEILEKLQELIA
jgi:hypothetical protein